MLILLKVMKKDLDKKGVIQYYNTLTYIHSHLQKKSLG